MAEIVKSGNVELLDGKVAVRATGFYREIPGYINNPLAGDPHSNGGDTWGLRLSLLAKPTKSWRRADWIVGSSGMKVWRTTRPGLSPRPARPGAL